MWRDDISISGISTGSGQVADRGGGATIGAGTLHGGPGGWASGSSTVWRAVGDLARVAIVLALVLAGAWGIGAVARVVRPTPVHAAVLVTSQGEVFPSFGTCDTDTARGFDVDNPPCHSHTGPR